MRSRQLVNFKMVSLSPSSREMHKEYLNYLDEFIVIRLDIYCILSPIATPENIVKVSPVQSLPSDKTSFLYLIGCLFC